MVRASESQEQRGRYFGPLAGIPARRPSSAPRAGFEPAAYSLGGSRSIRLSYRGSDGDDSPRLEPRVVELRGVDQGVDELLDVRRSLDLAEVVGLAARDGQLRGEQLAAVLIGK